MGAAVVYRLAMGWDGLARWALWAWWALWPWTAMDGGWWMVDGVWTLIKDRLGTKACIGHGMGEELAAGCWLLGHGCESGRGFDLPDCSAGKPVSIAT